MSAERGSLVPVLPWLKATQPEPVLSPAEAFDALPDGLQLVAEQLKELFGDLTENLKVQYFKAGTIAAKAHKDAEAQKYEGWNGKAVIKGLAAALGISWRTLYAAKQVAERYSQGDFKRLLKRPELSWTHIHLLAAAAADDRKDLEEKVVQENWSARTLYDEVKSRYQKESPDQKKPRGPGRSRAVPRSFPVALERLGQEARRFDESFKDIWLGAQFNIGRSIVETPPDELTTDQRDLVQAAIDQLQTLATSLPRRIKDLEDGRAWIDSVLALRDDAQA